MREEGERGSDEGERREREIDVKVHLVFFNLTLIVYILCLYFWKRKIG
jgi:hypothetical protein